MNLKFKHSISNHLEIKYFSIFLSIVLVFLFQGCEKDDICSEETQKTPLLKISFLNVDDENVKTVPFLQIGFEGAKKVDDDNDDDTEPVPILLPTEAATVSEILVPLDTQSNSTTFYFIQNSGQIDDDMSSIENTDTVQVVYTRVYDYVSRACGYKITFNALAHIKGNPDDDDEDRWIKSVFVPKSTVENSEETHIIIRH